MRRYTMAGLALALLAVMGPAWAGPTIYECEDNGRKVFSQQPCGANAREVKTEGAERTVRLTSSISNADIDYLCSLTMRSWEKNAIDQRNKPVGYYGGYSHSRDQELRRQAFVLSHIENLEKIAANDPELYDVAKRLSQNRYYGQPGDYLYDAERAKAQASCVTDIRNSIDRLNRRRQAEDDVAFGHNQR